MHSCIGEDLRRQEIRLGKEILLTSTETLSKRFDPKVGSIRSYDFGEWQFLVIIDNKHDEFGNIF
jgi:unsaturated chondroitin disaccharide hydrolase